jgi:hypothetical protein
MSFDQPYPKQITKELLLDPNTFATTLVTVLIDFYGTEFLNWAPETIRLETEADFGFTWTILNFDRLMAGIVLLLTDRFYKSLPDFIELCTILSGAAATPDSFVPADAAECAWGITEALLLSPPDNENPFTDEIRGYIGKAVEAEGIITPPDILRIGITDTKKRDNVQTEFSDDPEMYSAIWDTERSKTDEINMLVKERLMLLVNQLGSLKLQNGDTSDIAKRMLMNLNDSTEDTPLQ